MFCAVIRHVLIYHSVVLNELMLVSFNVTINTILLMTGGGDAGRITASFCHMLATSPSCHSLF